MDHEIVASPNIEKDIVSTIDDLAIDVGFESCSYILGAFSSGSLRSREDQLLDYSQFYIALRWLLSNIYDMFILRIQLAIYYSLRLFGYNSAYIDINSYYLGKEGIYSIPLNPPEGKHFFRQCWIYIKFETR